MNQNMLFNDDIQMLKSDLNKIYDKCKFIDNYSIGPEELESIKYIRHQIMQQESCSKDLPIIDFVTVAITNICNLKCINCSAYIPLVKEPRHFNLELFETHLKQISELAKICTLNIEGAEPFTHPLWHKFAAVALKYIPDKIGGLSFYTNGTIVPQQEQLEVIANNDNVHVCISDYGEVSKNIVKLCETLTNAKIKHYRIPYQELGWNKVSEPHHFHRSDSQLKFIYSNCRGRKYCPTIRQGIFTRCGGIFKVFDVLELEALKKDFFSYSELFEQEIPLNEIQQSFNRYWKCETALETCNYCNGLSDDKKRTASAGLQKQKSF